MIELKMFRKMNFLFQALAVLMMTTFIATSSGFAPISMQDTSILRRPFPPQPHSSPRFSSSPALSATSNKSKEDNESGWKDALTEYALYRERKRIVKKENLGVLLKNWILDGIILYGSFDVLQRIFHVLLGN